MASAAVDEIHAAVLHSTIWINKQRTNHADFIALGVLHERVQPTRINDLDVVVQKQEIFAARDLRAGDTEGRPVEGRSTFDDAVGGSRKPRLPGWVRFPRIVDADDLEISIAREFADR